MRIQRSLRRIPAPFWIIAAVFAFGAALFPLSHALAQPNCNWDCTTYECCGSEVMCGNGSGAGTYGMYCATFCIGPSVPAGGTCPY